MLVACVLLCAAGALGFNVDIPSRVVYRGYNNSMFGFTVQAHVDGDQKMILVGAPEADSSYLTSLRRPGVVFRCAPGQRGYERGTPLDMCREMRFDQKPGKILVGAPEADSSYLTSLRRPGVVFRCAPGQRGYERGTPLDMCREMRFDQKPGNNVDKSRNPIDQKSNQWFGATLSSTGRNGPIVACAPRYVSFVNAKLQHRDPVGSCFVAPSSNADPREINEYSPCRTHFPSVDEASHGHRKTGICQAGFSAAISRDGQRMFMGAPGSFYWQGRTISIDPSHQFNSHYMKIPEEGQVYSQSTSSRPVLIATPEGSPKYDDQYMGYSMTVGDFSGQGEQGVAVAVPRGADLRGLVVLYTWELQNIKNITGSQIGAYFGYSLASGDIDGDGTDDIIVGAPMFTKPKTDGFEHGRIYVIYQGRDRSFMRSDARTGEVSRGRFGLAVTSLGDINYDGFGDIAVGAPYGGENGRGVVYIYQGSELGIQKKYSQAITAEEISPSLRTFGFSLSGGVDLDNNNYTDLAVGAYKSDSVVFLKSRPVVKVMAEVRFLGDTKLISLTDKRCAMNGTQASCSELMYCLRYDGINVDRQIKFEVSLDLDSRQTTTKRILTERRESVYRTNIMLEQGRQKCQRLTVYLDEEIRDKLTPIEVKMTYNLVSQPTGNIVPPVLDQTQSISAGDSLNIQKNCGPDNVCIPNLSMEASTNVNDYVLGSGDYIVIDVKVVNSGEDAFEAAYYLKIPPGVTYAKMERISKDNTNVYCSISHKDVNGTSALKCDMGNPLSYNEEVHFKVSLEVDATASNIQFYMEANSTNPEKPMTSFDNSKTITVSVLVKAMLTVYGTSDPPELHYNASQYDPTKATITDESQLGPQLIHKYNIKNEGPFTADEAEFYIMWPYQTLTGENLMYMLVQPQPLGNVRCEVARNVNPENLYVQNPYSFLLTQQKKDMLSSEEFASLYAEYFESNSRDWLDQKYYVDQTIGQSGGQVSSQGSQFGSNQGSSFHTSSSQSGSGWQSSSGQSSHASGGMTGGGYREENARGGGLTREEQESIRRQLAAAAQSGFLSNGAQQSSGGYHGGLANEGLRPGYSVIREKNKTIVYDEHHNIISETETSTEYDSMAQGQAGGSLYVNRNGGSQYGHSSQGSQSHTSSSQGYSGGSQQSFASGTQSSYAGSQRNYASGSQRNYASGSQSSYARAGAGGYQDSRGFVLTDLPTTETVNRDIMNADSSRFRGGVTSVGDADDDLTGVFADAARGKNGDFQYGMVHVGDEDQRRSDSTRRRRQASVDGQLVLLLDKCNEKYKCSAVRCTTGRLLKGQEVWVALRTRLNATVLNEISKDRAVKLSSLATAHVTRLPGLGRPARTIWHTAEAQTLVSGQLAAAEGGSVPLWVVVLAAVVGALLLLLLIFALYKCGFFKRNRPSDHTERQPLNGRDEHL